jgi:Zn-dependent protease
MTRSSFTLLRIRGIPIGVHWNWVFIFAIVVWSLATSLFPATYPNLDGTTYVVMALVAALLFFVSVLLHELGHALRANREGLPIEGITLWLLGGVSHLGELPHDPGAEFRVAV